jgi:uncharacterized protein (TIGR00369 family)
MNKMELPQMPEAKPPLMTAEEITAFLEKEFPQIREGGTMFTVEAAAHGAVRLRMAYHPRLLRPGGTISGPSMFALADVAMYVAVLSAGPRALAVTTNLNINFLRRPEARDMIAQARLLKLGKRLAIGEIALHSDGQDELVAHATATYSIPDDGAAGSRSSVR